MSPSSEVKPLPETAVPRGLNSPPHIAGGWGGEDKGVTSSNNSVGPPTAPLQLSSKMSLLHDPAEGKIRLPGAHSNQ